MTADFDLPSTKLVLIVDDDESLLDLMDHVVKKEGFRTDRAADGEETLRKVEALHPDLIVLDFMLPGMGGFEVLKELQSRGHGDIPIVIVTGRQMDQDSVGLLRQEPNVKEFLEKPIRPIRIGTALHRILRTKPASSDGAGGGS
ncbi:MAG: response regulator [Elusimicrobia bacterium]|nr:response regulator [Elusimicrobiota bacterium]